MPRYHMNMELTPNASLLTVVHSQEFSRRFERAHHAVAEEKGDRDNLNGREPNIDREGEHQVQRVRFVDTNLTKEG